MCVEIVFGRGDARIKTIGEAWSAFPAGLIAHHHFVFTHGNDYLEEIPDDHCLCCIDVPATATANHYLASPDRGEWKMIPIRS